MTKRMRVGIVGGQKRKTEAHLFKSLEEMDIEVAWHVEAMTNREFSKDCDCIVSMVDYVGHGLFAKAKEFARLNELPFRQITFNWSKAKPTFVELKEKFDAIHNPTEDDMSGRQKAIPPNADLVNADDAGKIVGVSHQVIRRAARSGKIKQIHAHDKNGNSLYWFSKSECIKYFTRLSEVAEKESMAAIAEVIAWKEPEVIAEKEPEVQTTVIVSPKPGHYTLPPAVSKQHTMILCKVVNGSFAPIIEIENEGEINDGLSLENKIGGEYIVVSVVKRFKASVQVVIEEV